MARRGAPGAVRGPASRAASSIRAFLAADSFVVECRRLWAQRGQRRRRLLLAAGGLAVVAGVALRFYTPSALWLDEAISVNIARLPLVQIPGALSHDGAPPLYYVLLHFWMLVFGQGNIAVRALSGVMSVAALPLFWHAGRRVAGRVGAWALFFLALSSPFAIYYATATRMYSQMVLLALLGFLAFERALEEPTRRRLVALGGVTAGLLYTHYWALYLVVATGSWLLWRMWRERGAGEPSMLGIRPAFGAMVVGGVCWLPWSPVFAYQTLHTGTPWASAAGPADLLGVFAGFSGPGPWGQLLTYALVILVLLGMFGRRSVSGSPPGGGSAVPGSWQGTPGRDGPPILTVVARPNPRLVGVLGVLVGTLVLAVGLGAIAQAAYVARYAAVVLPLFLLIVAAGVAVFADRRVVAAIVVVTSVAGLLTGFGEGSQQRTQAVAVAKVLNMEAQPGDLVVYCPDQLGPAVDRLLTVPNVTELTFPRAIGPSRVNWVNYKATIAATNVGTFAEQMLGQLGANHTLWVVERNNYAGFGGACGNLVSWFNLLRPTGVTLVHANSSQYYESENLLRYPS